MRVEWHGQSAFTLTAPEATVVIDPFGDMTSLAGRRRFEYPPIAIESADLVLVTHEHLDHNGVEAVGGAPAVLRSTAGRLSSPIGELLAVASEHDESAGTERGPNTIFAFALDGLRVAHFGDFGQRELRPEQADAIGAADLLFLPVGGGPTIGAAGAAAIASRLAARWVVPMHYRTHRVDFLETEEDFVAQMPQAARLDAPSFDTADLPSDATPTAIVPATP
ncbi:MAG TPA: MBL fold metallo-hydrolase [Solirubrobacterales bacterium]|nr:MBL fold metallo-hydrolase [Solirubrobacterales bacterium]